MIQLRKFQAIPGVGFLLAICSPRFRQSGAGSIQGTIEDVSGAALPGSTVHVVNEGTGVVNDATANGVGAYAVQAFSLASIPSHTPPTA